MKFALVTWQPKPNSTNDFQSFCEMYFATSMTRQTAHIPTLCFIWTNGRIILYTRSVQTRLVMVARTHNEEMRLYFIPQI